MNKPKQKLFLVAGGFLLFMLVDVSTKCEPVFECVYNVKVDSIESNSKDLVQIRIFLIEYDIFPFVVPVPDFVITIPFWGITTKDGFWFFAYSEISETRIRISSR